MSHITLAQQGLAAVDARQWDEAITKLSKALQTSQNPGWLIARSKALVGSKRFEEALNDANLAWYKAYDRNKRDALAEAHYRRAVAHFRLKQYADADRCCIYSMRIVKGHPAVEKEDPTAGFVDEKGFWKQTVEDAKEESRQEESSGQKADGLATAMGADAAKVPKAWRLASAMRVQALSALERLPVDDPARQVSVKLKPPQKKLADIGSGETRVEGSIQGTQASTVLTPTSAPSKPADAPLRLQEFQNDTTMSVSIFSKGNKKEELKVDILPSSVTINPILYPNGEAKAFKLDLWGEIDATASRYTVTPSKVELSLKKSSPGKWSQLKSETPSPSQVDASDKAAEEERQKLEVLKDARKKAMENADKVDSQSTQTSTTAPAPSYPTSSRSGPKDWDKLADDSDHEEDDGVNTFFKKIYKGATPEQQRAMMKSFTESNGTSLSTDWNDVKDRTVDTVPPEGVEAKKWD